MRLPVLILVAVLFLSTAAYAVYRMTGSESEPVSTEALLNDAQSNAVETEPGYVVIIESRQYHRGSGEVQAFDGSFSEVPNETETTARILIGNKPGTIAKKHIIVLDLEGNVVQEELYDGESEYVYHAPLGQLMVTPVDGPQSFRLSEDIDEILASERGETVYMGLGEILGKEVHLIERRYDDPVQMEPLESGGYRRVDTSDLNVAALVSTFALGVENLTLVERRLVSIEADDSETLLDLRTTEKMTVTAVADITEDTFSLQHVPQDVLERDSPDLLDSAEP